MEKIPATDQKGEIIKDAEGNIQYQQEDYAGLFNVLRLFDSRQHTTMDEYKIYVKTKDAINDAWMHDKTEVELSLDEAKFLKDFLAKFPEGDGKGYQMKEFEIRTLISIAEQLH
jgi:hypothetical protein